MPSLKTLGPDYHLMGKLDAAAWPVAIGFNLAGLVFLIIFGRIFLRLVEVIHPELAPFTLGQVFEGLSLGWLLLSLGAVLALHELIHGLFFWFFTGQRPHFGFRLVYAYAAAPGWYLPRGAYMVTGAAPFAATTTSGLLALAVAPASTIPLLFLALTFNAAGSTGDFFVLAWLLASPRSVMVQDTGISISVFHRPRRS